MCCKMFDYGMYSTKRFRFILGKILKQTHYFHRDQIGIPSEMTDKDGNLLWLGNYIGWGRLKEETKVTDSAHQSF